VPADAPISKTEAARGQGAEVIVGGGSLEACIEVAQQRAKDEGLAFVHPFDDHDVVAGQGSLGLELLEDVPDLATDRRPRRRGRAVLGDRRRGQERAPGGQGRRGAGGGVRAVPGVPAPRPVGASDQRAHHRRRDRGQAAR
jgi:hypothetical protein